MEWYAHQKKFLKKNPNRTLLCHGTGTGKTLTAIEWANQKGEETLVIVPKAIREQWQRNVDMYGKVRFFVTSKEDFRKHSKETREFKTVIVDEAHVFAGMKSQMSKSLRWYLSRWDVPYILLATASPYRSSPWDIYVLAKHLGYKINYVNFKMKFFQDKYIGRRVIPEVRPGMEDEIAKIVHQIGDVVALSDVVDVPEQLFETEYFDLTPEQVIAKESILELNPLVRFTAYHSIENTAFQEMDVPSYKNERIKELVFEHNKMIVVCRYNRQIDILQKYLSGMNKKIFIIRGNVKNRDSVIQQAEKENHAIILVQAACSVGWEMPSVSLMVFASLDFSMVNWLQMQGRIRRINNLHTCLYLVLLIKDGVDVGVWESIQRKQDFNFQIYVNSRTHTSE